MGFAREYVKLVKYSGVNVDPRLLMAAGVLITLAGIALSVVLKSLLPLVLALVLADIVVMGPYFLGRKKVEDIEANLSEALRQMAAILRSGGTFEVAVKEIALSDYGELSKEFARMLREIEGGKSFVAALQSLSIRVESRLLDRVAIIIADAIRTGGRVADVLDEIADDIRAYYQTRKERRARTTMQFFFILAASAILGPFLMGITMGISDFLFALGGQMATGITPEELAAKKAAAQAVQMIFSVFVLIQAVVSAFVGATMREGKAVYGVVYAPIYVLLAYVSLELGRAIVHALTGI